ncbi:MAG: hypothetical protein RBR86_05205 [Pseudobdellovibrionaceae bacterium]|jgi:hypothetical protein|nr:hypothetical protein [Pseudobdellovibrionaceae bacterium]
MHTVPDLGYTTSVIGSNDSNLLLDWSRHQTRPFGLPVRVISPETLHKEAEKLNLSRRYQLTTRPTPGESSSHNNSNFIPDSICAQNSSTHVPVDLIDIALFKHMLDFIERTPELASLLVPDNLWKLRKNVTDDTQELCTRLSQTPDKFFPSSVSLGYSLDYSHQEAKLGEQKNRCGNIVIEASEALSANDFIPALLLHKNWKLEDLSGLDTDFKLMLIWHEFAHSLTSREYLADFLGSRKAKSITHSNSSLNFISDGRALSAVLGQDDTRFYKYGWACVEAIDHTIATPIEQIKASLVPGISKWADRPISFAGEKLNTVKKIRKHLEQAIGPDFQIAPLEELCMAAHSMQKPALPSGIETTILARFTLAARRLHGGYKSYIKQDAAPIQMLNALMLTR